MDLQVIESKLKEIEKRASDIIIVAKNEKIILKQDIDEYESLSELKEFLNNPNNKKMINSYVSMFGAKKLDEAEPSVSINDGFADKKSVISETKKDAMPAVVESKVELPIVATNPATEEEGKTFDAFDFVQESSPLDNKPPLALLDGEYKLKKDEIVQDLPIYDKSEQIFKDPGMSDEQILASQQKIAETPLFEVPSPLPYTPMTPEEIQASQEIINGISQPSPSLSQGAEVQPEKKPELPSIETPNEPVNKTIKVKKRSVWKWLRQEVKSFTIHKGIAILQNRRKSTDFQKINLSIVKYRSEYKLRTASKNKLAIDALSDMLKSATTLTEKEKNVLLSKLTNVIKITAAYTRKQAKKVDNIDTLGAAMDNLNSPIKR